jgi:hypothetical protein
MTNQKAVFSESELASFLDLPIWKFKEYGPEGCISSNYINQYYERSEMTVSESFSFKDSFSFYVNCEGLRKILNDRADYDYWKEGELLTAIIVSLKQSFPKEKILIRNYRFIAFTNLWFVSSIKN